MVTSINGLSGVLSLTLSGAGTLTLSEGTTSDTIGTVVSSFTGASQDTVVTQSGAVTLSAGDVSFAVSSGNVYNLIDYGGDPSGAAASDAALNNCLAAAATNGSGSLVYIPAGTYKLTSAVALTSANNISIAGDGPYATILSITHSGVGLTLVQTGAKNCISIRDLSLEANDPSSTTNAALSITLPGVQSQPFAGAAPCIVLLCDDVRVFGTGSASKAFMVGLSLTGGVNSRLQRFTFGGSKATPYVGTAIELTSAVEVHIDSCQLQNAQFGVAILDGACQGIYLRNGTFVNLGYLLVNVAYPSYNSVVSGTLASSASGSVVTLDSLGINPLEASAPWIGKNMQVVSGSGDPTNPVVTSINPASNTVTLSESVTLSSGAVLGFQYGNLEWSAFALAVINSEIAVTNGAFQLGLSVNIRIQGNNFEPATTIGTLMSFSDVAGVLINNNYIGGVAPGECFNFAYAVRDANDYVITGNVIGNGFSTVLSIGSNVFDVNYLGNVTGPCTSAQFTDSNTSTRTNLVLYSPSSNSGTTTLTSLHPLEIINLET